MRLLFYAINGVGLGHVRRLLLIAEEIRRQKPEAHILFITNSAFPQMIEEKGFPCILLPSEISPTVQSHFSTSTLPAGLHDKLFLAIARHFSPNAIVFDSAWSWEQLEFAKRNGLRTVLILRKDTNEHMSRIMEEWKRFDLITVAHSEKEFAGLGAPKRLISHLKRLNAVFAGPVVPTGQRSKRNAGSTFKILVTAGGGGWPTTQRFIDTVSDGLRVVLVANENISAEIVTGPLFRGTIAEIPRSTVHRYLENSELLTRMRQSHLAIAQAGYNTCNDLVAAGLPAILIPAKREIESQEERALYFQNAGCAQVIRNSSDAIQKVVEQLYHNRSVLEKMREACDSALGKPGTPLIARKIISLVPQVTRVTLGKTTRVKDNAFVVARGRQSAAAVRQLAKLRNRVGFLALEAGLKWFKDGKSVKELCDGVDAVILPLTHQQSLKIPKELRAAIRLLRESGPYFEVRVPVTPELTVKMAAIAREFHTMSCPQVQFHITPKVKQEMLEEPLSGLRKFVLGTKGDTMRIYCSRTPIVPSEFPEGRLKSYREVQSVDKKMREHEALVRKQAREHKALVRKRDGLTRKLNGLTDERNCLTAGQREAGRELKKLEKSKTLKGWHKGKGKDDALPKAVRRIDRRLGMLNARKECFAALLPKVSFLGPDEHPPELDKGVTSQWRAVLKDAAAVEKEVAMKQEQYLSALEDELEAVLLEQDAFKKGKAAGMTWRQLDLKRQRLISRHRSLWVEHLSALDEQRRLVDARKRMFAEELQAQLEALIHRFERDINKTLSKRQEALKRHKQELKLLSQNKEVKRYHLLKRQLERMDKAITALDEKISAMHQRLEHLG